MDPDITLCSQLCDLSYENSIDDAVITSFKSIGLDIKDAQITTDKGSVSFSYDDAGRLFIAWRGTKTFLNLVQDMDILRRFLVIDGTRYGKVHSGLLDYYDSIKDKVAAQITDHLSSSNKDKDIVFSGYSLGACICFAALECAIKHPNVNMKVITFASPMMGNKSFVKSFDNKVKDNIRVVLDADAIPKFRYDDFLHVKGEFIIRSGVRFSWLLVFLGLFELAFKISNTRNLVKYHYLSTYLTFM